MRNSEGPHKCNRHGSLFFLNPALAFIIYANTLLYLGIHHANTNEEKAMVVYARGRSTLVLINYGLLQNQVFHSDYNVLTLFRNIQLLFNVQGSWYSQNTLPTIVHYYFCIIIWQLPSYLPLDWLIYWLVLNANFRNISAILRRKQLLCWLRHLDHLPLGNTICS
jgi:hypothetical protein